MAISVTTVKDHYSQSCFTYSMKRGLVFKTSIFAVTIFFWCVPYSRFVRDSYNPPSGWVHCSTKRWRILCLFSFFQSKNFVAIRRAYFTFLARRAFSTLHCVQEEEEDHSCATPVAVFLDTRRTSQPSGRE
jgi:hypothetical protein